MWKGATGSVPCKASIRGAHNLYVSDFFVPSDSVVKGLFQYANEPTVCSIIIGARNTSEQYFARSTGVTGEAGSGSGRCRVLQNDRLAIGAYHVWMDRCAVKAHDSQ